MIVRCIYNDVKYVPEKQREYAITQDADDGLDITVGKHYIVYATKQTPQGLWYFVHTDRRNPDTLWWMPAALYEVVQKRLPDGWKERTEEDETLIAYPSLHNWEVENDILDGEKAALQAYMTETAADPTSPSLDDLNKYNTEFNKQQREQKYEHNKELARERGYEWPKNPEDKAIN